MIIFIISVIVICIIIFFIFKDKKANESSPTITPTSVQDEAPPIIDATPIKVESIKSDLKPIYKESIITKDAEVIIAGKSFCITGDSILYTREELEYQIKSKGGIIKTGVSKALNYLVICEQASSDYKYSNHGTKTEKALQYNRDYKSNIAIIREDQLVEKF